MSLTCNFNDMSVGQTCPDRIFESDDEDLEECSSGLNNQVEIPESSNRCEHQPTDDAVTLNLTEVTMTSSVSPDPIQQNAGSPPIAGGDPEPTVGGDQSCDGSEARKTSVHECKVCQKCFRCKSHLERHYSTLLHSHKLLISVDHQTDRDDAGRGSSRAVPEHLSSSSSTNLMAAPSGEARAQKYVARGTSTNVPEPGKISCGKCDRSFTSQAYLKQHDNSQHQGEKRYKCMVCGKRFFEEHDMEKHRQVHDHERPFKCQICTKQYFKKCDLKIHMFQHTRDAPFQCLVCQKRFPRKDHMTNHLKTHYARPASTLVGRPKKL